MTVVEAQVRRLLRAWPAFDRADRGDEIVATTLDLVPPGARRLPLRLAASLFVGGLRARHRARPPVWAWLLYGLGWAPRGRTRWLASDVVRAGFGRRALRRHLVACSAVVAGLGAGLAAFIHTSIAPMWVYFPLEFFVMFLVSLSPGGAAGAVPACSLRLPFASRKRVGQPMPRPSPSWSSVGWRSGGDGSVTTT